MSPLLGLSATLLLLVGGVLVWFERDRSVRALLPVLVVLGSLAALGRVACVAMPGVNPTLFIVLVTGWILGMLPGFITALLAVFVSNLFLGHGPWTLVQIAAWGLVGMASGALGRCWSRPPRVLLCLMGIAAGFVYGVLSNLFTWISFTQPLTWESWFLYWIRSLPLDMISAATTALLCWVAGPEAFRLLGRYRDRIGR